MLFTQQPLYELKHVEVATSHVCMHTGKDRQHVLLFASGCFHFSWPHTLNVVNQSAISSSTEFCCWTGWVFITRETKQNNSFHFHLIFVMLFQFPTTVSNWKSSVCSSNSIVTLMPVWEKTHTHTQTGLVFMFTMQMWETHWAEGKQYPLYMSYTHIYISHLWCLLFCAVL